MKRKKVKQLSSLSIIVFRSFAVALNSQLTDS